MAFEKIVLDPDGGICLVCGENALDTGWECTECGADCRAFYYPESLKSEPIIGTLLPTAKVVP